MSNRIFSSHSGQTLVDLVVALALLSSSVASAGILSTTSSRSSDEGGRRSQATALADREIEGLRSLRDQTEHGADGWSATAPFNATACAQVTLKQSGTVWVVSNATATGPEAYVTSDFAPPSSNPDLTSFKRMVRLCPSNEYRQANSSMTVAKSTTTPVPPHAYTVEVTVTWEESNGTRQVVLNSMLTDYMQ